MTMKKAVKIAQEIVKINGGGVIITPHYGFNLRTDRAVRLTCCSAIEAEVMGNIIARHLPGGVFRQASGFAAIWFTTEKRGKKEI